MSLQNKGGDSLQKRSSYSNFQTYTQGAAGDKGAIAGHGPPMAPASGGYMAGLGHVNSDNNNNNNPKMNHEYLNSAGGSDSHYSLHNSASNPLMTNFMNRGSRYSTSVLVPSYGGSSGAGGSLPGYGYGAGGRLGNEPAGYVNRKSAYYEAPFPIYAADWTGSFGGGSSLIAVGSYSETSSNKIQVINANPAMENSHNGPPKTTFEFQQTAEAVIPYPSTRIMWDPHCATPTSTSTSISTSAFESQVRLATSGESLRLWDYDTESHSLNVKCVFSNSKCGSVSPVTSFDWSKVNNNHIVTSSIDTTCTVWDLNTTQAKTQLIAHDKEVYDVKYTAGSDDVFVSVGADGSIRVFDLRALDHSTIIYEPANPVPLVRLSTNPLDCHTLAAIAANENDVYILDIRSPGVPIATLKGHQAPVNSVIWAPPNCSFGGAGAARKSILATAGDDCQVLVWNVTGDTPQVVAAYSDSTEINNLTWGADGDWIGAVSDRSIQGIRLT